VLDVYVALVIVSDISLGRWLLSLRVAGAVGLTTAYLVARRPNLSSAAVTLLESAVYVVCSTLVSLMAIRYGGLLSRYQHGISLLVLVSAAATPSRWQRALVISLAIVITFPVVMAA